MLSCLLPSLHLETFDSQKYFSYREKQRRERKSVTGRRPLTSDSGGATNSIRPSGLQAFRLLLPFVLVAALSSVVMVVLTAICLCCKKWLHKEDYSFEEQMQFSSESTRGKDVLVVKPSTYWLLGFKDRDLEEEYLNDLVVVSKKRLYLGYGMCAFFILLTQVTQILVKVIIEPSQNLTESLRAYYWEGGLVSGIILYFAVFLVFVAGLMFR